jgi:hypothetical protein
LLETLHHARVAADGGERLSTTVLLFWSAACRGSTSLFQAGAEGLGAKKLARRLRNSRSKWVLPMLLVLWMKPVDHIFLLLKELL